VTTTAKLQALADRWASAKAAEQANLQSYVIELCGALGVEPPRPAGGGYEFELPVKVVNRDGTESVNFIDLYKAGHFALEGKDEEAGRSNDVILRKAFGQVRGYVGQLPGDRPPYLLVLDVGKTLLVWDRWNGDYGGYSAARRLDLTRLAERPEDQALLRDIWTQPAVRDPRTKAVAVTKELAAKLADLAADLESQGYAQERVAKFVMRCVFTMFAEDIGLLPDEPFRQVLDKVAVADPREFVPLAEELWHAMDEGKRFLLHKLLRFNGHVFRDAEALPLSRQALSLLLEAARADWQHVEPSIFGTLLVRALDPEERHRLGAEFTPRAYVERVVRPAVEEPIRERWTAVQAEVLQLRESGKAKDKSQAEQRLRDFHSWLRGLRFLDPACGSGNFLYVTMHLVKRIELEVIRALEEVTGQREARLEEVGPAQFHGIEIKAWAREIAELTLWIGYHQFWREHHDVQPPEPILRDTGTLECRDAVLAYDRIGEDPARARPDPSPRLRHPVTGALVPDAEAIRHYFTYENARQAEWPRADFIVGNPPYLGQGRQREEFGDGYVDALRAAYSDVPDTADYVMYWWYKAAMEVAAGRTIRAGLITTNTITQAQNREVVADAAKAGASVVWAVPDHPWNDEKAGAAVRVALTVMATAAPSAVRVDVSDDGTVLREVRAPRLNADLTAHADVAAAGAGPLLANEGLSNTGFKLHGAGFVLEEAEAAVLLRADPRNGEIIRPYRNGRDLTARPRGAHVIDFANRSETEALQYPLLFDLVRDRVKPEREANRDQSRRKRWWRFGRSNAELRAAAARLGRYIATPETSKHRFFTFLDAAVAPDNMLICVASANAFHLGVLSSSIHVTWTLAAGGTLEDRPRYNKSLCFDPFPFPDPPKALRAKIADAAERLDAHRKAALARDERVTMTGMYNVVEKLRSGAALTAKEQAVHTLAACGVLKDMHEELDALVAEAYGWEWPQPRDIILERLVALHGERVREEKAGKVRWLRPDYQIPRFAKGAAAPAPELALPAAAKKAKPAPKPAWPATAVEQIGGIKDLLTAESLSAAEIAARFEGGRPDLIRRHVETLALMGEVRLETGERYVAAGVTV
jgi:hypothetical protein